MNDTGVYKLGVTVVRGVQIYGLVADLRQQSWFDETL